MKNRNVFRCVECGAGVFTESNYCTCYKCGGRMEFECKEIEFRKQRSKNES